MQAGSSSNSGAASSSTGAPSGGRIRGLISLCEACASGRTGMAQFLIDLEDTDLDACGIDGMSPLCISATWGSADIVQLLLDAGCDPNVRNEDGSRTTALHAASIQQHGKIIHLLLQAGADATLEDSDKRTACDFASVSDGLWPLFAARGYTRTPKDVLIAKRVIHKLDPASEVEDATTENGGGASTLSFYSRPGSAYARSDHIPGDHGASTLRGGATTSKLPQVPEHGIDLLASIDDDDDYRGHPSLSTIGALWRDGF